MCARIAAGVWDKGVAALSKGRLKARSGRRPTDAAPVKRGRLTRFVSEERPFGALDSGRK
jgi:hypothetical protein